ncbi:MAG TPA: N-acetylmuramoyl-L-alanine amidase [Thermoanaerobaculia bacterium]|nr:N-acetylmuramoyl-L-alanine amidase [Thermoanaerobaculia bacterium]
MTNVDRIKRQLVRDLVQENLDLIEDGLARRVRRRHRLWLASRVLAFIVAPVGLFGSTLLLKNRDAAPPRPASAAVAPRPAVAAPTPAVPAPDAMAKLAAPQPIDAAVFPLAVRKIAIDAGHGGESLGTRAPLGLIEKDLTLDIALRLKKLLEKDFQVVMTRETDKEVSLEERGTFANQQGADIFVSVHLNWIVDRESRGVETYYLGPTDDPFLTELAANENRESGYSMADMRKLLDRIYADVRQDKSKKLAQVMQSSLYSSLGKINPKIEDRGVKAAPFIVLLSTEMPAILAEVSCLSNEEEARLLTKPLYRQYIAEALAQGLRAYADSVEGRPDTRAAGQKGIDS